MTATYFGKNASPTDAVPPFSHLTTYIRLPSSIATMALISDIGGEVKRSKGEEDLNKPECGR